VDPVAMEFPARPNTKAQATTNVRVENLPVVLMNMSGGVLKDCSLII
jgi:hypothetical protein